MKRKQGNNVSRTLILTLFCLISLSTMLSCSAKKQASTPDSKILRGSVVFVEGTVTIDGKIAEVGSALEATARVETGADSSCEILFDGKNIVKIMPNTFAELDFSKVGKEIKLQKGGVAAVLKKLEAVAGTDSFRISGPTAVAGVRGTSLCVWADEKNTYVCACNGKVHTIDSKGSNEQELEASHHAARLYSDKSGTISAETAGMLYHTDAGVEALAAKIGYAIDWTKID